MVSGNDQCPAWADQMIRQIAALEIRLGNITKPTAHRTSDLEDLIRKTADDMGHTDEAAVDALFQKVSRGLAEAGYDVDAITQFINAGVAVIGGPTRLPYCDATEVRDALD